MKDNYSKEILNRRAGVTIEVFLNKGGNGGHQFIHRMLNCILSLALAVSIVGISVNTAEAEELIRLSEGDEWHYFKGAEDPPYKWNQIDFDDSSWLRGPSGFGYGGRHYNTVLDDMRANYESIYVRREFTVRNPAEVTGIKITVICDGPFRAYLNGIEVIRSDRSNFPINEQLDVSGFAEELFSGVNVFAIQCFNDDINSRSFSLMPSFRVF